MKADPVTITAVITNPRAQRALVAVSDATGVPIHQLGELAIQALLAAYGHHRRGPEKGQRCGRKRRRRAS